MRLQITSVNTLTTEQDITFYVRAEKKKKIQNSLGHFRQFTHSVEFVSRNDWKVLLVKKVSPSIPLNRFKITH